MNEIILVTDDDPTLRMLMREILETNLGVEVVEATDGDEAWKKLDAGLTPSLCILDERMPKVRGLSLLARMRGDQRFKSQKVMLCSTVNKRSTILEAVDLHVDAIVLKPFEANEFLTHVRSLLKKTEEKPAPPLDPMEQVLKRLGIDAKVYLRLWDVLSNDIQSFVQSYSTSSTVTKEDFQLRASAIKGAVSSLGAAGLMNLFAALEKVESVRSPDALRILKAIDEEHIRVLAELAGVAQSARKS
jgi:two-component system chemotaxis response regulator CheY